MAEHRITVRRCCKFDPLFRSFPHGSSTVPHQLTVTPTPILFYPFIARPEAGEVTCRTRTGFHRTHFAKFDTHLTLELLHRTLLQVHVMVATVANSVSAGLFSSGSSSSSSQTPNRFGPHVRRYIGKTTIPCRSPNKMVINNMAKNT